MKAPSTYAEWAAVLDTFSAGSNDTEVIPAMQCGTLDWQDGVANRFADRLVKTVNIRLDAAHERFALARRRASDDAGLHHALVGLRREYATIASALNLGALPSEHREKLLTLVREHADKTQRSLERSASETDRSGKISSIVRNAPVNKF